VAMRNSSEGDDECVALAINIEQCRDLMIACTMARLESVGWSEGEAQRVCDKAIDMMVDRVPGTLERMAKVCGSAASDGAPARVLNMLASALFAIGGVEIADALNKSRIASMN
jgi:hypothetical protein